MTILINYETINKFYDEKNLIDNNNYKKSLINKNIDIDDEDYDYNPIDDCDLELFI